MGQTVRRVSPNSRKPEHARYAAGKILIFTQGNDTLRQKVLTDLSAEERGFVVEESSDLVLSLWKRETDCGNGQSLSEDRLVANG